MTERIECERRLLDRWSFEEAAQYLDDLYPGEFGPTAWEAPARARAYPDSVHEALSLAAIVSYSRPFTERHDREGKQEPRHYAELYLCDLTPDDRAFHEEMLRLRNEYLAHADAETARIRFPADPRTAHLVAVRVLPPENARRLWELARTMQRLATDRYQELRPLLVDPEDD